MTYLSPTFVMAVPIPSSSKARRNPKLLITVATTRLLISLPCFCISFASRYMILSPSISLPFSSINSTLSPSPSKAMPASALCSFTASFNVSRWVEPQFLLMLKPSFLSPIKTTSAFSAAKTRFAASTVAPFAQSTINFHPLKSSSAQDKIKSTYCSRPSR